MDVDTRQLRSFVTLSQELHFTRAARQLFITQPTLSQHISRLETTLGYALFERSSREVRLTGQGTHFLAVAHQMLALLDEADGLAPVIRLATNAGEVGLPTEVIRRLRLRRQDGQIVVTTMTGAQQLAAVRSGELTVGWVRLAAPEPDLGSELVRLEPLVLCQSADVEHVEHVSRIVTVTPDNTDNVYVRYMRAYAAAVGVELVTTAVISSSVSSSVAAAPPDACFIAPGGLLSQLQAGGATVLSPDDVQPYYAWSLVWRPDSDPALIGDIKTAVVEVAAEHGWLNADPALPGVPWLPPDDPYRPLLPRLRHDWGEARRLTAPPSVLPNVAVGTRGGSPAA